MKGMEDLVRSLTKKRVAVLGEIMLDRYLWGSVERISPEAPIPVMRLDETEERLGGAGCVVNNLLVFGADVMPISVIGDDSQGKQLLSLLERKGAIVEHLFVESGRPTIVKTRMIGYVQSAHRAMQHILRLDEESVRRISKEAEDRLIRSIEAALKWCDIMLVSDYNKGMLSRNVLSAVIEGARGVGKMVLIDPRRSNDYSIYKGATAMTPNRYEASLATGEDCSDFSGLARAASKLLRGLSLSFCIITIDKDGQFLMRADGSTAHFPTRARAVYDVTGAGDMVLASLGLVLAHNYPVEAAIEFSNIAAGIKVTKVGAASVTKEEILEELHFRTPASYEKIKKQDELVELLRREKANGKVVVFTNGCFDLLHPGHIRTLEFAKEQGDVLVVGLNSDSSIRRLKGEGRPINSEDDRARVLAALSSVDYVVIFDEDNPEDIIRKVRPDVLVKGEDWQTKGVVGKEFVESYGGRCVLAPMLRGYSTSGIIGKIESFRRVSDGERQGD